jgi:thioredoxin reductase (NADPH)
LSSVFLLGVSLDETVQILQVLAGKTLVVGASYIALECAGFLHALPGHDVTVAVRSIVLRGFDRQCSEQIAENMEREGVRFLNPCTVTSMARAGDAKSPITVTMQVDGKEVVEEFNTVLFAIGRTPLTKDLGLDTVGVTLGRNGWIVSDDNDTTNVPHVHAIGDVVCDAKGNTRPELTPVAIQAGQLLARRLYGGATRQMDYHLVPTTVFTPMEYGACGLSQEDAEAKYGAENIEVYATRFGTLETAVKWREDIPTPRSSVFLGANLFACKWAAKNNRPWPVHSPESYEAEEQARAFLKQPCLAKLVCDKKQNNKVVGFHYIGPHAGEVTQGFALAVRVGATKEDFDNMSGIHPTAAEEFTTLQTAASSGEDFMKKGGC